MLEENVVLKIDLDLKIQAAELFESLGIDLNTATNLFYQEALKCNGFPFEITYDEPNIVNYNSFLSSEK